MDNPKQTRDESGQLVTEYQKQGPLPVPETVARKSRERVTPEVEETPAPSAERPRRSAVFVAHGMGQQIRFQTMDDVVWGLRHEDLAHRHHRNPSIRKLAQLPPPRTNTIEQGGERIQRVELSLLRENGEEKEVHVFEGYWAPLVEGKVTLRDVIGFFFRTGQSGIRNGASPFKRWIFGKYEEYEVKSDTARHFGVALLVVLSLVIMNFALMGVGVLSPAAGSTGWLSGALFEDLTTVFNVALTGLLFLAMPLAIGLGLHQTRASRKRREKIGRLSWIGLGIALFTIIFAGIVALPAVLIRHFLWIRNPPEGQSESALLLSWRGGGIVERFNAGLELALWIAALGALAFGLYRLLRLAFAVEKPHRHRAQNPRRGGKMILWLSFLWFLVLLLGWAFSGPLLARTSGGRWHIVLAAISWALLLIASAKIRTALIQYTGDVAAYVSPQVLDRFNELRQEIRDTVYRQAAGTYACMENEQLAYDEVLIVGHSLGSVVVYDVLNRLIAEDELIKRAARQGDETAWKRHLDVLGRTRLLLTFGSPLDKTAFVFSLQGQDTSETREALAAEVQPLIKDPGFRTFPWVNIWSPQDIFSGELDFYHPPPPHGPGPKEVINIRDKDATTLLLAHVEYWRNPTLFGELYKWI